MFTYDTKFAAATDAQISEIEILLGSKLPGEFATFLREDGGGYSPEPSLFKIPGEGDGLIKTFYGFSNADSFDLRSAIQKTHTYPRNYIPVAVDHFGNRVVLGMTWLKRGKVYWCDHELNADGTTKKPILLATRFSEFLESLRPSS